MTTNTDTDIDLTFLRSTTPVDGSLLAGVPPTTREEYDRVVERAHEAFRTWREVPAPQRGEIVRQIGDELRAQKDDLGRLVAYEMGKIADEDPVDLFETPDS